MPFSLQMNLPSEAALPALFREWREDTMMFIRHDAPKIVFILVGAYILIRMLRTFARKSAELHVRKMPPGIRVQAENRNCVQQSRAQILVRARS